MNRWWWLLATMSRSRLMSVETSFRSPRGRHRDEKYNTVGFWYCGCCRQMDVGEKNGLEEQVECLRAHEGRATYQVPLNMRGYHMCGLWGVSAEICLGASAWSLIYDVCVPAGLTQRKWSFLIRERKVFKDASDFIRKKEKWWDALSHCCIYMEIFLNDFCKS